MKQLLQFLTAIVVVSCATFTTPAQAQCNGLFFSEYVEGYSNNKALEIYNASGATVNMSNYGIIRFDNGSSTVTYEPDQEATFVQLPADQLAPNDVYVVVIDRSAVTESTITSTFDKPVWNGYLQIDQLIDIVTGEPVTDDNGDPVFGVVYDENGAALFDLSDDAVYYEEYDLQGKADAFVCQDYFVNKTMSFNGNDAMALVEGTTFAPDGSNLLDVIGVIGEDPEETIGEPAWIDADGGWLTRDRTLVRNSDVSEGRNSAPDVVFASGGTFTGGEWTSYAKNDFSHLGFHESVCGNTGINDAFNAVEFNLYPQPAQNEVRVEAPIAIQKIEVYNINGQKVKGMSIQGGLNKIRVDVSDLDSGMYMTYVTFQDGRNSVSPLVIN